MSSIDLSAPLHSESCLQLGWAHVTDPYSDDEQKGCQPLASLALKAIS